MQQIQAPGLALGQEPKMSLGIKLAPQMRQLMDLLALPIDKLQEEIKKKLEENPALEEKKSAETLLSTMEEPDWDEEKADWDEESADRKQQFLENTLTQKESLQDHLLLQLGMQKNIDKKVIDAAEKLVQSLNDDGFLVLSPQEAVPEADDETLKKAASLVQMLDPQGTCVADYKESLLVQASLQEDKPDGTEEVIKEHLEELEQEQYKKIAAALKITVKQVLEIRDFISRLNPFPGRIFSTQPDQNVVPSLTITAKDGGLRVYMNDLAIPELQINPSFKELDESPDADTEAKKFTHDYVQNAQEFIKQLNKRKKTIKSAAKEIARCQKDFFLKGPKYLKPLTQREFAKKIKRNESTVSRIANSKYIQTDWGFYPFSYFFPTQGDILMEIIKEIMESNKDKNLSNQKISEILKERGFDTAVRTVSKYTSKIRRQV